jgi:hypothetical protein
MMSAAARAVHKMLEERNRPSDLRVDRQIDVGDHGDHFPGPSGLPSKVSSFVNAIGVPPPTIEGKKITTHSAANDASSLKEKL